MFNGGGGFSQPGTREVIHRTENEEILADDARGWRVILLNVIIACLVMLSIVLLGPLAIAVAVPTVIILFAIWLSGNEQTIENATITNDPVTVIWSIATVACLLWILTLDFGIWRMIVAWYPIKFRLPWYVILPAWVIIGAILSGVQDTRISHRQSLYNRNWPPTYSQMTPDVGPYYEGGAGGEIGELPPETEQRAMQLLENLAQQVKPQFVDRLVTVIDDRSKAQAISPIAPFDAARLVRANGGNPVRLGDVEKFCKSLDAIGATVEAWSDWGYTRWHDMVVYTAMLGITTEPRQKSKTRAQMSSADALTKLYAMYPPAPNGDKQSVQLNGETDRQIDLEMESVG